MKSPVREWREALDARLGPGRVRSRVPLAPLTTFRIGGPADLYLRVTTPDELSEAVRAARAAGVPHFLLGRGANILVGDGGVRGFVIHNRAGGVEFLDGSRLRAGSGVEVFPDLVRATLEREMGGLHHFAGIPSTVGGAMWQNLHFLSPAPERERTVFIGEVVASAVLLTQEGETREVGVEYFRFGYDESVLHRRDDVVLSVTFRLMPTPRRKLRAVIRENLRWRDDRHPDLWLYPSAGSVFKKVKGTGAGRLIDECGLKGHVLGGAQIFHRHANIIVNLGDATARDVRGLMELARERVLRETGQVLEPEISLVGEF